MIPADKWPEWADRHCWDEDGCGEFYGAKSNGSTWMAIYEYSDIPLPPGHDWRVPVIRQALSVPSIDAANARRLYHHVVNGGSLSKDDVSRLVVAIETRDSALQAKPAPAIDMGQFREAVESLRLGATRSEHHEECDRLLALIDGQGKP